jgi:hypothetical protein
MLNTLDITVSGYPEYYCIDPDGKVIDFKCGDYHSFWKFYSEIQTVTLNLVNVESFKELHFPVIERIDFTEKQAVKGKSSLRKWLYKFFVLTYVYDIDVKQAGIKKVTYVKMRSGESYMIDESTECLKNALDGCVWTAEFLKSIER